MTATKNSRQSDLIYNNLGVNEQAIIDKVRGFWLHLALIHFVGLKMKLHFTWWR